jgi:hypothetical protein
MTANKNSKKTGKEYYIYRLCESYRIVGVRARSLACEKSTNSAGISFVNFLIFSKYVINQVFLLINNAEANRKFRYYISLYREPDGHLWHQYLPRAG